MLDIGSNQVESQTLGRCYSTNDCQRYSASGGTWTKTITVCLVIFVSAMKTMYVNQPVIYPANQLLENAIPLMIASNILWQEGNGRSKIVACHAKASVGVISITGVNQLV